MIILSELMKFRKLIILLKRSLFLIYQHLFNSYVKLSYNISNWILINYFLLNFKKFNNLVSKIIIEL